MLGDRRHRRDQQQRFVRRRLRGVAQRGIRTAAAIAEISSSGSFAGVCVAWRSAASGELP
jgi:hypothetical protein